MYKKQKQNLIRTKRCIVDCVLNCSVWPSPIIVEVKVPFAVTAWNLKIGICRYISDSKVHVFTKKLKNIGVSMPALQMKRGWEPLPLCDCTFYEHLSLQRALGLFSFYSGSWAETKTYILINFYSEIIRNNPTQKRKTKNTRQSLIYNFQVGKK